MNKSFVSYQVERGLSIRDNDIMRKYSHMDSVLGCWGGDFNAIQPLGPAYAI